jgi:hypothetical protein
MIQSGGCEDPSGHPALYSQAGGQDKYHPQVSRIGHTSLKVKQKDRTNNHSQMSRIVHTSFKVKQKNRTNIIHR